MWREVYGVPLTVRVKPAPLSKRKPSLLIAVTVEL